MKRLTDISLEDWKALCATTSHLRPGDTLVFHPSMCAGGTNCSISGTSVYIGAWFARDIREVGIKGNTGWYHE